MFYTLCLYWWKKFGFFSKTTNHKKMRLIFPHKRTMYPLVEGCSCSWMTFWEINQEINVLPFSSYTLVQHCYFPLTEPSQKAESDDPAQHDHVWAQCENKKWGPPTTCNLVICVSLWQNTTAMYRKKDLFGVYISMRIDSITILVGSRTTSRQVWYWSSS